MKFHITTLSLGVSLALTTDTELCFGLSKNTCQSLQTFITKSSDSSLSDVAGGIESCPFCEEISSDSCVASLKTELLNFPESSGALIMQTLLARNEETTGCSDITADCLFAEFQGLSTQIQESSLFSLCSSGIIPVMNAKTPLQPAATSDSPNKLITSSDTCTYCADLTDKSCLTSLNSIMSEMDTDSQLFLLSMIYYDSVDELCVDAALTDADCLAALSTKFDDESDKIQLTMLTWACESGYMSLIESSTAMPYESCPLCAASNELLCESTLFDAFGKLNTEDQMKVIKTNMPTPSDNDQSKLSMVWGLTTSRIKFGLLLSSCISMDLINVMDKQLNDPTIHQASLAAEEEEASSSNVWLILIPSVMALGVVGWMTKKSKLAGYKGISAN